MALEPWYKVVTPRKEVRDGRSFNPDEFAIHLEQVVAKTAPEDYRDPAQFFSRTCWTRALQEHVGMVLRRLSGRTDNTAPVLTLITQFGGGKTHTLASLYHLAQTGSGAGGFSGVEQLLQATGVPEVPQAATAVFVGNAWDPQPGRETPWLDMAYQLAKQKGIEALGESAKTTPPGTEALGRLFAAAGGTVLILFDEVLNFLNRHRGMADSFHAFIQNLTVATTGTTRGAAVISLPRSQVEMTEWDMQWQEKITKVVRRVAKDLIANDEAEIGEVLRRRLFEDIGPEKNRKAVAKAFADWCFERRAQLPPEWTAVDTASTEKKAREYLQKKFEDCYPFHPATISVFQRKWQSLSQFQQTRGTLAMLAQWISKAAEKGYKEARKEPLITLGSAPLQIQEFRSVVLGQLGESRLVPAIDTDIAGGQAHARSLDADTTGPLRDIHRRVATTILFESSGGQIDKVAHLPELRFALGEPELDTTSIDTVAYALEARAYYLRKVGADGFRIFYQPTLKKVVSDRRASLDAETEVKPTMRTLAQKSFEEGASMPIVPFPGDSTAVPDSPRLSLVIMDPDVEWTGEGAVRERVAEWTTQRGISPRLYPGSLVWCYRKPGREFREKVENWLAWKRVSDEVSKGVLGGEFDKADRAEVASKVSDAKEDAEDEVWAGYRYVVLADSVAQDGLRVIDLGAGHASQGETLCGRVITALKSQGLLNEGVGSGYIDRNWPPALKESGAWPLTSLRQSFLNGALTRLPDPDTILRKKIAEFVEKGEFGLASGQSGDGFQRVWFQEGVGTDEISFDANVFLLTKARAQALKLKPTGPTTATTLSVGATAAAGAGPAASGSTSTSTAVAEVNGQEAAATSTSGATAPSSRTLRVSGPVPTEVWNRLGSKLLPKLKSGDNLTVRVEFTVQIKAEQVKGLDAELKQILDDLGLTGKVQVEQK